MTGGRSYLPARSFGPLELVGSTDKKTIELPTAHIGSAMGRVCRELWAASGGVVGGTVVGECCK